MEPTALLHASRQRFMDSTVGALGRSKEITQFRAGKKAEFGCPIGIKRESHQHPLRQYQGSTICRHAIE